MELQGAQGAQVIDMYFTGDTAPSRKKVEFALPAIARELGMPYQDLYSMVARSALAPHFLPAARSQRILRSTDVLLLLFGGILKEHGIPYERSAQHIEIWKAGIARYIETWQQHAGRPETWMVLTGDPAQDILIDHRDAPSQGAVFEMRLSVGAMFDRVKFLYKRIHESQLQRPGAFSAPVVH